MSTNIYPELTTPEQQRIKVRAWADEATEALHTVTLSTRGGIRNTSVTLAIPLDEQSTLSKKARERASETDEDALEGYKPRREPMRRDSLKRREALLKGKEGSRRRQRWENDHLLNNPWAQPPLPSDWEVQPTHPRHVVPYFLAPLWDASVAARREMEQKARDSKVTGANEDNTAGRVPKELRDKLKRTKAAKGMLQDLEEQVRNFVKDWKRKQNDLHEEGLHDVDSDEEEIVFVGRQGQMHDMPPSPKSRRSKDENVEVLKEKLVFESLVDDHGASFGRWLVHSIATYYGLRTWSVTVGDPARREAYVGIRPIKTGKDKISNGQLPRPLWGMV